VRVTTRRAVHPSKLFGTPARVGIPFGSVWAKTRGRRPFWTARPNSSASGLGLLNPQGQGLQHGHGKDSAPASQHQQHRQD
jgi:hypothetical protein